MSQEVNPFLYALLSMLADAIDKEQDTAEKIKPTPRRWDRERTAYENGQTVMYRVRPEVAPYEDYDKWDEVPSNFSLVLWDNESLEFRVARPWYKEIIAWAEGKTIEYRFKPEIDENDNWDIVEEGVTPEWDNDEFQFRIQLDKPDPVKLRYRVGIVDEGRNTKPYLVLVSDEDGQSAWENFAAGSVKLTWLFDWRGCTYERPA